LRGPVDLGRKPSPGRRCGKRQPDGEVDGVAEPTKRPVPEQRRQGFIQETDHKPVRFRSLAQKAGNLQRHPIRRGMKSGQAQKFDVRIPGRPDVGAKGTGQIFRGIKRQQARRGRFGPVKRRVDEQPVFFNLSVKLLSGGRQFGQADKDLPVAGKNFVDPSGFQLRQK